MPTHDDEERATSPAVDLRPADDDEGTPGPELADCLADFSRARGYGYDPAEARDLAAACDGAGIDAERCRPEGWLTREAAECLATARMESPDATLASELGPDRARGRMVWTIGGSELLPEDVELRWEVELDATTGVVLRMRRSELVTNPWSAEP